MCFPRARRFTYLLQQQSTDRCCHEDGCCHRFKDRRSKEGDQRGGSGLEINERICLAVGVLPCCVTNPVTIQLTVLRRNYSIILATINSSMCEGVLKGLLHIVSVGCPVLFAAGGDTLSVRCAPAGSSEIPSCLRSCDDDDCVYKG